MPVPLRPTTTRSICPSRCGLPPSCTSSALVVGGFERVYELGRIFRNEGVSTRHNPEFTSVEIYQAYSDYIGMMELTEQMVSAVCQEVCGTTTLTYQGTEIDLAPPWRRATMHELVQDATGLDFNRHLAAVRRPRLR